MGAVVVMEVGVGATAVEAVMVAGDSEGVAMEAGSVAAVTEVASAAAI